MALGNVLRQVGQPEAVALQWGGYLFRVSYQNNSVTLTVIGAVPPGR